ncbi:bifunctional adenosylcobinamide kinase/adenosylcobinamide-phosphate guanylyltransferase [Vibrio aquaticus]|uniref:Bifunctional adenosylcobalamin biosynthesis protein n=1 Tax=Vibrio aquaticus TaxID=2496559 RepID=A0A432CT26_9VIBR|nr:bifunctional adenosylcobinamide kinase/adenosylcobinamide-phosphate guanylyltransferase [Vibrio aquaticus]RTZ14447.1 bifunctional adenosylcobinamide kinase/adenosylcobinamide-phosphate guanylyltransferase [Vibrio aquaticus]
MTIHFVLGGARSGKSRYAEQQVHQLAEAKAKHYVATAIAFDDEMKARVAHHQQSRGDGWQEHECPTALTDLLSQFSTQDVALVDCLTLWLNNVIYNEGDTLEETKIKSSVEALVQALSKTQADIVLVSNEVGLGVVPLGEVSRLFVDHAGWMNQAIAKVANEVVLVTAGLPLMLKLEQEG